MQEINYTDRSFNPDLSGVYTLSIQANSNGLAYSVCDNIANQIIVFKNYLFGQVILISDLREKIAGILDNDNILGLSYSKIRFLGYSRQCTLIPVSLYESVKLEKYLTFNNGGEIDGTVFSNLISHAGIYNIFSLPDEIVALIRLSFKKVEFQSQTTSFLQRTIENKSLHRTNVVYVGMNPEFFDIACIGNSGLLLYNTFQYTNETDFLYYILFVYNNLQFEPEHVPLVISGELSSKLSYPDMLRQYFSEVIYEIMPESPALASGLKLLNTTGFLNLLNSSSCESSVENIREGK